jgi:hypothetical protein
MIALGAAAVHAQYAPGLSPLETSKPWSLSATIRGFYDDNYLTLPKTIQTGVNPVTGAPIFGPGARDSFGVEMSPSVSYNHSTSDTLLSASYVYDLRWYEDRDGTTDQMHQLNAKLDHEFSERYKMTVTESFVMAQDPGVLDPVVVATPLRVPGSNVRNTGAVDFTIELSRLFDLHIGYANSIYAYQQNGGDEFPADTYASYSALLDRIDQTVPVDLRWKISPETTGVLGYQYEHLDYTSPEDIIFSPTGAPGSLAYIQGPGHYSANSRNQDSHFAYVGADQSFSPNLNGSIRAGAQYIDYYNYGNNSLSPYVDASMTYQYMPASTAQVGVKHIHNSTDVAGTTAGGTPVLDEESTAAYFSISHRVTSRFTAALMGQAQYSTFNGGSYNGEIENFYVANLNLTYHFTPWLSGETGYAYNKLNTEIVDRAYTRNQVYLGIRATY